MSRSSIHFLCRRAPMARIAIVTAFFLAAAGLGRAQGGVSLPKGDVFSGGGNAPVYSDKFSTSCSGSNTSPYAGMNPLSCYGVMMPTDSTGRCTGARGWRLVRQVGNTCYFCQRINPPINGIVIPFDQLNQARAQGFECGVDQANPNCMAVCTRYAGSGPYIPPGRQPFSGSSPVQRGRPPLQARVSTSSDPCLPFGPGGYDYCANPAGTQPRGCDCSKRWANSGDQEPGNGGPPDDTTTGQQPASGQNSGFTRNGNTFCLGGSATGYAVTPPAFQEVASMAQWQALKARAGKRWIDWDPFYKPLANQAWARWQQAIAHLNNGSVYDTQISFIVTRNHQIFGTKCAYGEYAQEVDSIVEGLVPPDFPAGSGFNSVPAMYTFGMNNGRRGWTHTSYGEFDGKLYRLRVSRQ